MSDLEADVDIDNEEWQDDDNGEDPDPNDVQMTEADETNSSHHIATGTDEDEDLAAISNRVLSVRNASDPIPSILTTTSTFPSMTDQTSIPATPLNITSRRNAFRTGPLPPAADPSVLRSGDSLRRASEYPAYLRPVTPTEQTLQEEYVTPNGSPSGQIAAELLISDGPMTPTNNAGPFVFDGSAGRAAGRRTVASLIPNTQSPA